MSTSAPLPNALLLLIHLHLLYYPLNDASGYDEHLFDLARASVRERTKIMENICYFLVGKLEGARERMKSVFPVYPCLRSSNTVAFRVSLAKYLEATRNDEQRIEATAETAWWWKDVIVRKFLLEECYGERFEKLMLALSTHVLLSEVLKSPLSDRLPSFNRPEALNTIPSEYAALLARALAARATWQRSAARLDHHKSDLALLRARLSDPNFPASKYGALATDRLIALQRARLDDVVSQHWRSERGDNALQFITTLAGLQTAAVRKSLLTSSVLSMSRVVHKVSDSKVSPPPPLLIAAARHPVYVQSLVPPLFATSHQLASGASTDDARSPEGMTALHAVSERIYAAERTRQVLQEALAHSMAV
ncbi:hypothetical protein OBBRIDRAFT_837763 [Obba rivulosa]|uniref:HAUS augmin-like complex subunit 6 N-terminal domain-containing protein n=1 Tax=Obba rivulosa TaxID=1052685 RepID=A0A8E2DLJ4_9APHY|nr:hypothetical protein OBBRIDRAFT_837763 [Obba rivulosa]